MDDTRSDLTRRRVLRKGTIAAGGITLGAAAFSGSAAADRWDFKQDATGTVLDAEDNPCAGESATATSGTLLADIDERWDSSGGLHVSMRFLINNLHLVGNETGRKYTGSLAFSHNENVGAGGKPYTISTTGNFQITSQGSTGDLHGRLRVHVTVNANGDITVEREFEDMECRG